MLTFSTRRLRECSFPRRRNRFFLSLEASECQRVNRRVTAGDELGIIGAIIKTLCTRTISHWTHDTQEPRGSLKRTVTEAASTKTASWRDKRRVCS